jgi:hypothetical protein
VVAVSRLVLVVCVIGFRTDGQTGDGRTGESTTVFATVHLPPCCSVMCRLQAIYCAPVSRTSAHCASTKKHPFALSSTIDTPCSDLEASMCAGAGVPFVGLTSGETGKTRNPNPAV